MTSISAINKPFWIEKRRVYEAYKAVKSNHGAAGVDGQTLETFEKILQGISTRSGTECLPGPTFRRRSAPSPFRRRLEARDSRCAHRQRQDRANGGQADD